MLAFQIKQSEVWKFKREWRLWARPDQLPPEGEWRSWLILGGRGAGKTRSGAEYVRALATGEWDDHEAKPIRIALVAPTFDEARLVMIEGQSGLLSVHPAGEEPLFEPSKRLVTWANGSQVQLFSAEEPDGLRGPQFDAAWCDELAKWKQAEKVWDMLQFALRLGDKGKPDPHWMASNLVNITPPFAMHMGQTPIAHFPVHRKCADAFKAWLDSVWANAGHDPKIIALWGMDVFSGSFNFRPMRGLKTLSMHAYGCAVDIDAPRNGFHSTTPHFASLRREVVQPFLDLGGAWGGDWNGNGSSADERRADGMHFQFAHLG